MESPRKFNDCYFYYYSTCTKGDNCVFRHEPSALGCETMCSAWQQGKCLDKRCKLRHMELRKNRKQIPCYWENQPGGCRKKHCPFMHKNPDARTDGIAPSQPSPVMPAVSMPSVAEGVLEPALPPAPMAVPAPALAPAPAPMLWQHQHQHQQQRQVVLDSAILGVLPASNELLGGVGGVGGVGVGVNVGGRRVEPQQYAPIPVDPLVVNFEEESDTESAPSWTPTKQAAAPPGPPSPDAPDWPDEQRIARTKSQELLLLEKIQAEAAAFYSYDNLPPVECKERKINRTNHSTKYDRLTLDEIAGKKGNAERRKSLDFKVLSLDEIRARKKTECIIQSTPITINLSRKRTLSTQETVSSSGNKIIKVVRSNSIVYRKVDPNAATTVAESSKTETDQKQVENVESRKRTLSEISDIYDIQVDELVDNCHEFKRIKIAEQTSKPKLIRNRNVSLEKVSDDANKSDISNKEDNDSDSEVQIISVDIADINVELSDIEVIDVDATKMGDPVDIVDLSDDDDVTITNGDLPKNVPDVVASCQKKADSSDKELLKDIDCILNEDSVDEEL